MVCQNHILWAHHTYCNGVGHILMVLHWQYYIRSVALWQWTAARMCVPWNTSLPLPVPLQGLATSHTLNMSEAVVTDSLVTKTLIVFLSWFVPQSSILLRTLAPTSDGSTHFRCFWIDLRPHWVIGLLLILSHGLLYVSIILLYLIFLILLDYISTSDLHP